MKYIVKNPFVRILLTRDCNSGTNPRAKHGGHPCRGFTSDSRICINDKNCPGASKLFSVNREPPEE
jgi:hypothetical protein